MSQNAPSNTAGNRLLALLPAADYKILEPNLQPIDLPFKSQIYRAQTPIDTVYFPTRGVASAMTYADDTAIEVATIGNEGMLGLSAAFAEADSPNDVIIQVAGAGLRISAAALRSAVLASERLRTILLHYLNAYFLQVGQSVACNGLHKIRERCCRWLLMTQDRVGSDQVPLTHEFLGVMLGVRRASVSEILAILQTEGLLRSEYGTITITNRAGLEAASCKCYRTVADEYARLLR
ncbi:MAG: Crp/Fnr family transcriptional regulator [Gemmataceae bacterium]